MNMRLYVFLLGRTVLLDALILTIPLAAAVYHHEPAVLAFALPVASTLLLGAVLLYAGRRHKRQLGVADGTCFLLSVWLLLGLLGMAPYVLTGSLSPVDAFFESMSACTTTGISILSPSATVSGQAFILWRSLLEWLGGLTFVIMLVTVLPQVSGCFGVTLSAQQSVTFSPVVGRMHDAAVGAGKIYGILTLISTSLYFFSGLSGFDAFTRAMATVSLSGGMSALDFIGLDNFWLELAAMVSMFLASCNFLLVWKAVLRRDVRLIFRDTELRAFLLAITAASILIVFHLWLQGLYDGWQSLRYGIFAVISFMSTTGYASAQFSLWPDFDRCLLFLLALCGGCIGSAAGGLRMMRILVLAKMARREMYRTLHPQMVLSLKIDGIPIPVKVIGRILSFFFLYVATFVISMLVISVSGVSLLQAMGIAGSCLSSTGAAAVLNGFYSFAVLPAWTKVYCTLVMVLGRVEIFPFLILVRIVLSRFQAKW